MPLPPRRVPASAPAAAAPARPGPPRPAPRPAVAPPVSNEPEAGQEASYLAYGNEADERVKEYQEQAASRANAPREFYITKAEIAKGNPGGQKGQYTAEVRMVFNYLNPDFRVAVPSVTIKDGGNFLRKTSPGADCAIAAAGVPVSIRPVYILMDHRTYTRQDGTKGGDDIKLWIPASSTKAKIDSAIQNLVDDTGIEPDRLYLPDYVLRITKIGSGKKSEMTFSFKPRAIQWNAAWDQKVAKFFGTPGSPSLKEYRDYMAKILAPDPKFLLSKGGTYVIKREDAAATPEEPPF